MGAAGVVYQPQVGVLEVLEVVAMLRALAGAWRSLEELQKCRR